MSFLRLAILACLGGLLVFANGATAEELTADDENNAMIYTWDNALFTLYHEIGHMLVDLYEIPVLAKEEDGVDNLATLMALDDHKNDADDPIILDAAYGWVAWMRRDNISAMNTTDFFDEHSINAQRAFQMICVLVGSDKAEFGEIATRFGLTDERQDRCALEYTQTKRSWDAVMAPHRKPNTDEPRVSVAYGEASPGNSRAREILTENTVLETVAEIIESRYTLPVPIAIEAAECGNANAYYNSGSKTITLCYEIVQQYYDQYTGDLRNGIDPEDVDIAALNREVTEEDAEEDGAEAEDEAGAEAPVTAAGTESGKADDGGFSSRSTWFTPASPQDDAPEARP
jgi:hypothetical protein